MKKALSKIKLDKQLEDQLLYEALAEGLDEELFDDDDDYEIVYSRKKSLLSYINIKTLLILVLTLIINTYAWFLYVSTVSTEVDVHIKSWDFDIQDNAGSTDMEFRAVIYPGMQEVSQEVTSRNNGEASAKLSIDFKSLKVLDEEYVVGETDDHGVEITSNYIYNKLQEYPFKIEIKVDDVAYNPSTNYILNTSDSKTVKVTLNWPYETGSSDTEIESNDAIDTEWGNRAYEFYQTDTSNIIEGVNYGVILNMDIKAEQYNN